MHFVLSHSVDMKLCVLIAAAVLPVGAWVPSAAAPRALARRGAPLASAQLDYDDPVVAEEFKVVQRYDDGRLDFELEKLGIVAPPGMSEVDKQLMLMECRLRLNGHLDDKPKSTGPKTYASPYEEALDTKPKFAALIGKFKADGLINSVNTIIEYVNDPVLGKTRYAEGYGDLIEQVDAALAAPAVESAKLKFFGFPSNMGEGVVRRRSRPSASSRASASRCPTTRPRCRAAARASSAASRAPRRPSRSGTARTWASAPSSRSRWSSERDREVRAARARGGRRIKANVMPRG